MTDITEIFNNVLPELKGGEIKAYWLILQKTIAVGKRNTIILNDEFMKLGPHITKVRDVMTSTNSLKEKGLIFKVLDTESEYNNFRYSVNLEKVHFGQGERL